jgi:hypothetical protein
LFRVLVLMGGSLALSCGGSVQIDGSGGAAPGGAAQASGGTSGAAQTGGTSGAAQADGGTSGAAQAGGGGTLDCPPAQWDCSAVERVCAYEVSGSDWPAGCVCDLKRPKTVADCGVNENLVCLGGWVYPADPTIWDGQRHVQCTCEPKPEAPSTMESGCAEACFAAYPAMYPGTYRASCHVHNWNCDSTGSNCTATAAEVLRQDGIVCGCAPVILK